MIDTKLGKSLAMAACAVSFMLAGSAAAGPPLICHPLDAGDAELLP